jgi:esterase/lipase superfamily enzyme
MATPVLQHFEEPIPVSVRGLVIDDLGDVVQGAAVNLIIGEQPVGRAESSDEGTFVMSDLQLKPGIHKLRASRPGYATSEETLVVTKEMSNSTKLVILRLNPGGWEDVSKDASELRVSALRRDERRSLKQKYASVDVFFATDRKFQNVRNLYKRFGGERSNDGEISYGICEVSIPEGHRIGHLESPIFKLQLLEDPSRHVVVMALEKQVEKTFFENVSAAIRRSTEGDAFVFVHGYNVTFGEAVRRTAQMAFDLGFHGAPICYSWPSSGEFSKYMADEAAVEWTVGHLTALVKKVAGLTGAKTLHLIAHSMGNRALARALESIGSSSAFPPTFKVRQVILAAPDIDRGVFTQLSSKISALGDRTTLYASSNDLPLAISQQFHAYPRAGEGGENVVLVQDIDTIDASSVPSGFLGHSYYAGTRTVLTDLYELVKHGTPPPRFGLKSMSREGKTYWLLLP